MKREDEFISGMCGFAIGLFLAVLICFATMTMDSKVKEGGPFFVDKTIYTCVERELK